jgi:flavin-dependent dehydrogenase
MCRRTIFDNFLVNEMQRYPQVTFRQGVEAFDYKREGDHWVVADRAGKEICAARLLLVADGAQSRFSRHIAGLEMSPRHHTAAVRGYYKGVSGMDAENFVELHFLKEFIPGYFWVFPLPNGWANVGAGMRSDTVSRKRVNLRERMTEIVDRTPQLRERFANAHLDGRVEGFGLPMGSKKRCLSGEGYLLLGDACWLIDPFTGEGIGNAVVSAKYAAVTAAKALEDKHVNAAVLAEYDAAIYRRMWSELRLSTRLQNLLHYPWLFNMIVNKATRRPKLRDTISLMYENVDLRQKLKRPGFYLRLLFS